MVALAVFGVGRFIGYAGFSTYAKVKLFFTGEVSDMTVVSSERFWSGGDDDIQGVHVKEVDYMIWTSSYTWFDPGEEILVVRSDRLRVGAAMTGGGGRFTSIFIWNGAPPGWIILTLTVLTVVITISVFLAQVASLHRESKQAAKQQEHGILAVLEYSERLLLPVLSIIMMCLFSTVLFKALVRMEHISWWLFGLVVALCAIIFVFACCFVLPLLEYVKIKRGVIVRIIGKVVGIVTLSITIYRTIQYLRTPMLETQDSLAQQMGEYVTYLLGG